jgi:hypothetical protein
LDDGQGLAPLDAVLFLPKLGVFILLPELGKAKIQVTVCQDLGYGQGLAPLDPVYSYPNFASPLYSYPNPG